MNAEVSYEDFGIIGEYSQLVLSIVFKKVNWDQIVVKIIQQ